MLPFSGIGSYSCGPGPKDRIFSSLDTVLNMIFLGLFKLALVIRREMLYWPGLQRTTQSINTTTACIRNVTYRYLPWHGVVDLLRYHSGGSHHHRHTLLPTGLQLIGTRRRTRGRLHRSKSVLTGGSKIGGELRSPALGTTCSAAALKAATTVTQLR